MITKTITRELSCRHRSRGAVIAVVLIVLVVMMLGAVSMLRSVDTSALLSGNLAFKRDSLSRASLGLNQAFKLIGTTDFATYSDSNTGCNAAVSTPSCSDTAKWLAMNYSPKLLETDSNGVPLILKDKTAFDAKFNSALITKEKDSGTEVRFLIERMCNGFGPPTVTMCTVSDHYELGGSYRNDKPGAIALPCCAETV
mgnify:CR=1 FL=1